MQSLIRLLVRFILVPLGYLAAVLAGSCVILAGSWHLAGPLIGNNPDSVGFGVVSLAIASPIVFAMIFSTMWLPGSIGILISEVFAIRSWIFHALNGAITSWAGWQMYVTAGGDADASVNATPFVFGAGLAAGFAYWAIAGWSAGFWRPIHPSPVNPPAPTKA